MESTEEREATLPQITIDPYGNTGEIVWESEKITLRSGDIFYSTPQPSQSLHNISRAHLERSSETDKRGSGRGMLDKLKFTPPKEEEKDIPRYATYVAGRGMKLHTNLGSAKNSFNNRAWEWTRDTDEPVTSYYGRVYRARESFILELVDGDWYTLYHVPAGTKKDELPWIRSYWYKYEYGYHTGYWQDEQPTWGSGWKHEKRAKPMTKEEYAEWRVRVDREQRAEL